MWSDCAFWLPCRSPRRCWCIRCSSWPPGRHAFFGQRRAGRRCNSDADPADPGLCPMSRSSSTGDRSWSRRSPISVRSASTTCSTRRPRRPAFPPFRPLVGGGRRADHPVRRRLATQLPRLDRPGAPFPHRFSTASPSPPGTSATHEHEPLFSPARSFPSSTATSFRTRRTAKSAPVAIALRKTVGAGAAADRPRMAARGWMLRKNILMIRTDRRRHRPRSRGVSCGSEACAGRAHSSRVDGHRSSTEVRAMSAGDGRSRYPRFSSKSAIGLTARRRCRGT